MSDLEFYFPAFGSFLIAAASALVAYLVYRMVKGYKKKNLDSRLRGNDKGRFDGNDEGEQAP